MFYILVRVQIIHSLIVHMICVQLLKDKNIKEEWQKVKERHIIAALEADPVDLETLRREAVCRGGLLTTDLRRKVWPKLVGVNRFRIKKYTGML